MRLTPEILHDEKLKPETSNKFTPSGGLSAWLEDHNLSLAFTSYDSGMLYLLGQKRGGISLCFRKFGRAMGLAYRDLTLYMAADGSIIELENDQSGGESFDAVFIPRRSTLIQRLDCHEIAHDGNNIIFANTSYSCVSALHRRNSCYPIWKPNFISQLVPEDRCHLNGIALRNDKISLVSICNTSDCLEGWRSNRRNGGMIYDVENNIVLQANLSMPHSPRWHDDKLSYLDSGRGFIIVGEQKIFCPGFLRGLSFVDDFAIVTVSLPREGVFKGLELEENLKIRGAEPWCGILIVDLNSGAIVHHFRIEGETRELFDVVALPGIKSPNAIAPNDPTLYNRITMATGPYQP